MATMAVAQALAAAGYVREADVRAVAAMLGNVAQVSAWEERIANAGADRAFQQDVINRSEDLRSEAIEMGDYGEQFIQDDVMQAARELIEVDQTKIRAAELELAAACHDAAAALLATELITEEDADAVALMLADVWRIGDDA